MDVTSRTYIRQLHSLAPDGLLTVVRQRANLRPSVLYLDDAPDVHRVSCTYAGPGRNVTEGVYFNLEVRRHLKLLPLILRVSPLLLASHNFAR